MTGPTQASALSLRRQSSRTSQFAGLLLGILSLLGTAEYAQADNIRVALSGGTRELRENVRAHLGLGSLPCDLNELQLRSRLRGADASVSEALRALGYYQGQWEITRERPDDKCWRIGVRLQPGQPVTVSTLDIALSGDGADDPIFLDYLARLPLNPGDVLHHGHYESIKSALVQRGQSAGYLDGRLTARSLRVDSEQNTADIRLDYETGPRYRFGELSYSPSPLGQALLDRLVTVQPGAPFESARLIETQNNLINSLYFSTVSVDQGRPDRERLEVPVTIRTEARQKYETTASVGFSTDIGPRLGYTLANRRVNARGDTYQVSSQLSPVQSNLGFQYSQPGRDPLRERTQWSTGWQHEDTDTSRSDSYRAEVARITQGESGWLRNLSLKFLFEDFDIAGESESSMLLMPGIGWSKSRSNDARYPTSGWRLGTAFRGALEGVVSDVTLVQAELDGKVILPFLGGRVLGRAGFAATAIDDFSQLPASLRFFAGGDNSVRGYDYQTLGPTNREGEVVGGRHRVTGSLEYDHKVWGDFALAAFVDAGSAFNTREMTLHQSAGFGVRWFSPIGPIRVDFAFPLKDGGFRLHLSMGPDL